MLAASNDLSVILILCAVIPIGVLSLIWHFSRSRSLLETWAAENGYRIVSARYRTFARGPFFWTTSKGQTVYRVEVVDSHGRHRAGYVRCGTWLGGLFSNKVEARWDDEA